VRRRRGHARDDRGRAGARWSGPHARSSRGAMDARRKGAADRGGDVGDPARDRRPLRGVRRHGPRAGAAALLVLAVAGLTGCCAGPKEARALPLGIDPPRFLVESFDARGTLLLGTPQGVFRSSDAGASWQPTFPRVFRGVSAGFTKGSTIVSRGRRFQ